VIRVGIVGGTGYTGVELLRLLVRHPGVELAAITSRSEAGRAVGELFPSLRGHLDLRFSEPDEGRLGECDVVLFATPNGTAMRMAPALLERGARVIDLAADFRLRDAAEWQRWYGEAHACPELLAEAVYGLPELNREAIRAARLVANPGCYPTAVLLGLVPLLEAGMVDPARLVADCKSGVSGAGRKAALATQFCEVSGGLRAYAAAGHRHRPEIEQWLRASAGEGVGLTFVPHLAPMIRGIHATLYGWLRGPEADLQALYEGRYRDEPFVDVLPAGAHPDTGQVRASNRCQLAWHRPGGGAVVVVLVAIDNLVKGAAGQAVQNLNLMCGLAEDSALGEPALVP